MARRLARVWALDAGTIGMNKFADCGKKYLRGASQYVARSCEGSLTKFLSLVRTGLVGGAVLGLIQPALVVDAVSSQDVFAATGAYGSSGQGVYGALRDLDGATANPQRSAGDDAFSALAGFAQSIPAGPKAVSGDKLIAVSRQGDDAIFTELTEFAQRVGADRPVKREARVQVAEADSAFEALSDFMKGNTAPPATPQPMPPKAPPARATKAPVAVEATYVGEKVCMTCHAGHAESFSKTLMGRIGKTQPGKFACENCHGPGSAHAKAGGGRGVGGIISFRTDDLSRTPAENNAVCLNCHEKGDRTYWNGSIHETRNLACTNCHTVMKSVSVKYQLKTVVEAETCFQCHKDRRAQMARSSHMPLREGKMTCSDCHQPHGTANESLLRTATINDTCYKCHAEKRGPFLFEHTPVRENCLNCHDAHGSINEFMLRVSRPRLCTECHGFGHGPAAGFNSYQIMGRACNNCHTQIHGTNSPSGALLHR
jgi:DmsE family decaheme c-type cytochrome